MGSANANVVNFAVSGDGVGAKDWVGRTAEVEAPYPVEAGRIADFCSMLEDPNPVYWDEAVAIRRYGGPVAPPGTLTAWRQPSPWHPEGLPPHGMVYATEVPLPVDTLINVGFRCRYFAPIHVGDRLRYIDRISSISEEKRTALGRGYFVKTETKVKNQAGKDIAEYETAMFRYRKEPRADTVAAADSEVPGKNEMPEIVLPVTMSLCAQIVAGTRDYFPGHHDPDYARSQGVAGPYPNTGFYCGLMDRVAVQWADFKASVLERELRMVKPAVLRPSLGSGRYRPGVQSSRRSEEIWRGYSSAAASNTTRGTSSMSGKTWRMDPSRAHPPKACYSFASSSGTRTILRKGTCRRRRSNRFIATPGMVRSPRREDPVST